MVTDTKPLVPYLINDRVFDWIFLSGDDTYFIRIQVKKYISKSIWIPQECEIEFSKKVRTFINENTGETVSEVYYECSNAKITYDVDGMPRIGVV